MEPKLMSYITEKYSRKSDSIMSDLLRYFAVMQLISLGSICVSLPVHSVPKDQW